VLSGTSLTGRFAVFLAAAVAVAIAVQLALCQVAVRRALYEEAAASYRAAAGRLAHSIERSIDDGLPFDMLPNAQQLVEIRQAADRAIRRIAIADAKGASLYDTDSIGESVPADWRLAGADGIARTDDGLVASRPIVDSLGVRVGTVFIVEDQSILDERLNENLLRTATVGVLALAVIVLVGTALAYALVRPLRRWSSDVVTRIDAALTTTDSAGAAATDTASQEARSRSSGALPAGAARGSQDFAAAIASTEAVLRDAEQELLRVGTTHDAAA
jgi:hypothetical protein